GRGLAAAGAAAVEGSPAGERDCGGPPDAGGRAAEAWITGSPTLPAGDGRGDLGGPEHAARAGPGRRPEPGREPRWARTPVAARGSGRHPGAGAARYLGRGPEPEVVDPGVGHRRDRASRRGAQRGPGGGEVGGGRPS